MNDPTNFSGWELPEENWSKLPHQFFESGILAAISSMAELKVILYTLRHTWGFGDPFKRMTIDEYVHGRKRADGSRIDAGTGLSEKSVRNGIARAVEHRFMHVQTDDTDKARVKRYFGLTFQNTGGKSYHLDRQKLPPHVVKDTNRTEKETEKETIEKKSVSPNNGDTQPEPEKPTSPRKRNPIFDAVAEHFFGISEGIGADGPRIGNIAAWLEGKTDAVSYGRKRVTIGYISEPATASSIAAFAGWYRAHNQGASLPRDLVKISEHWRAYLSQSKTQQSRVFISQDTEADVPAADVADMLTYDWRQNNG